MNNRFLDCQTVKELQQRLREDADRQDRWPTRLILVSGLAQWRQVLTMLADEVTQTIRLSAFCQGSDSLPHIPHEQLASLIKADPMGRTLILPVSELLRLHEGLGGSLLRFLITWEYISRCRAYVPLWQAEELVVKQLQGVLRWQAGQLPPLWILQGQSEELQLYLVPFSVKAPKGFETSKDLKTFLESWEMGGPHGRKLMVTTAYAQAALPIVGQVELRVCRSGYEFVREFLRINGDLKETWGAPEHWDWLAQELCPGESFSQTAARLLNVNHYDFLNLAEKWAAWPPEKRWLFWLWSKLLLPGRYAREVLRHSCAWENFPEDCWVTIFQHDILLEKETLAERRSILEKLGEVEPPATFWDQWEALQDPDRQLRLLTGLSQREKEEAVTLTQRLLQAGRPLHAIQGALELAYPELAWYLTLPLGLDDRLAVYLKHYRKARLLDQATPELYTLAEELAADDYIYRYEARHKILEAIRSGDAKEIWIDGCGVEWLGFIEAFCRHHKIAVEINVARANLPSITAANKDWPETTTPVYDLDKLAHSYDYRFPHTFVKELEWLKTQLNEIIGQLSGGSPFILTADHGFSPYIFHKEKIINPPTGAEVDNRGRCARIYEVTPEISANLAWHLEGGYISLKSYGRFYGSGGSVGEVHGGATLEEVLVPVLVLKRREAAAVVSYRLELRDTFIRFDAKRTGTLSEVWCEPDPGELHLRTWDQRLIIGRRLGKGRYAFTLTDLQPGEFFVQFEVQGQQIKEMKITVTSAALQEEDLGI